jgi:hypothetical protein
MTPPAGLSSLSTNNRMVCAAVCQPLAASPWKEPRAATVEMKRLDRVRRTL